MSLDRTRIRQTDRQTTSFIDCSTEAGILLGDSCQHFWKLASLKAHIRELICTFPVKSHTFVPTSWKMVVEYQVWKRLSTARPQWPWFLSRSNVEEQLHSKNNFIGVLCQVQWVLAQLRNIGSIIINVFDLALWNSWIKSWAQHAAEWHWPDYPSNLQNI